jgi:cyclohexa-1,5-dienecarbonyl-CoA hydratase
MDYRHIKFESDGAIGRITLRNPPLNIIDLAMMREILNAVERCTKDRDLVGILFSASSESRAFSAGVSVEDHQPATVYQMIESFHSIFRTLNQSGKPTVAVVDGMALGGGCELVAMCDIVIASETSRFGQPEIKLGLFPPLATVVLPRVIGEKRARELLLTADLIDSIEAARIGLVNHVVPKAELEQKTSEVLDKLRALSTVALEATNLAINRSLGKSFDEALLATEDLYLNELMKTADAREGIKAFLEKRKPVWRNR